jgi:multiple sugar transport system ATP-binding protein
MNQGVIQQFGTADEIYERPDNLFVAQFIGSPAMNMLPAKVMVANGRVTARPEAIPADVDLSTHPFTTRPVDGSDIVLGMRPEHFTLGPARNGGAAFDLPVQYTERTGSDATALLKTASKLLAIRLSPESLASVSAGETIKIGFPAEKLNIFDARSGRRI